MDQITKCSNSKAKQSINMKFTLKIFLIGMWNIYLKKQLCGGLSLCFQVLMTSHHITLLCIPFHSIALYYIAIVGSEQLLSLQNTYSSGKN